ncbi:hypothetical protein C7441_11045 [Pseudaminobacter salicylatoxidans]|uniref:Uncharacterized protein n=1 Tax=Pseudaminobacter salicylatoxidans TaxID=93369 RepID=A0A316C0H3_PSESE|nr:hypothetical protein [Pseudaminobacter salicylatoxidans]PWJ81513.1 hypothetical protein C7441_11045 [Pseudaminobacter salicylatoxidans]
MARYLIEWTIDYEGDGGPEEAARWAWEVMHRPHSIANCFTIIDEQGEQTKIDLQEIDETAACAGQ